jgi:Flp pilus assembly pilin Flp
MRLIERLKLVRKHKSFHRDETAATAVEFAMVAPLFFLMLGITLETGLMMFTDYVLQTSVQEAARVVRTGQAQEKEMSAGDFKKEICKLSGIIIDCEGQVTVYMKSAPNFTALAAAVPTYLSVGQKDDGSFEPTTFKCGAPSEAVALIATYDWDFSIPFFMNGFGNRNSDKTRRLAGYSMFKNEPFPATGKVCK